MGLHSGVLLANPIPRNSKFQQALNDTDALGFTGKDTTPYLAGTHRRDALSRCIVEITGGKSLETNIALVKNNARVAAWVAAE